MNLQSACSHVTNYLAVFDEREQEPKAQYLCFVQVLENGNARWFVIFVVCVCLKPVGGLRCAPASSRAFRVGVCLLPPFFWVVCAANIQLFLYCCNGFGAKAFVRGRFFVVRANGLRALACMKRTKLWRASGCVNKRKVRAFSTVCVTLWLTACCGTGRFALQNGSF